MAMKVFKLDNGNTIYINKDDFQVCSSIMEAGARVKAGMAELIKRDTLTAVGMINEFNKNYIETFKDDPDKIASLCYDELIRLLGSGKGIDLC